MVQALVRSSFFLKEPIVAQTIITIKKEIAGKDGKVREHNIKALLINNCMHILTYSTGFKYSRFHRILYQIEIIVHSIVV